MKLSPNVLKLFRVLEDKNRVYLLIEYEESGNLSD